MLNSGQYHNKQYIKSLLLDNGYKVEDCNNYLKCNALFRDGNDVNSMTIYPSDNLAIDHVTSEKYSLNKFISIVLKIDEGAVNSVLKNNNFSLNNFKKPEIEQPKVFSDDLLKQLLPIHDYWTNRCISESTLKKLGGGLYSGEKGSLKNRYLFPIFNSKKQIVGISGRDITEKNKIYWILKGQKVNWCYPAFYNSKIIQGKKSVWLVEGIGDLLSLMEAGIENVLVLFGTELNLAIINYLLKINIQNIYISTNDDSGKNNAGNEAANKIYKRLNKYFSYNQIKVVHPKNGKDWNVVLKNNGKNEILEQLKEYIK
jgi:hypothetical protein